jgi:hypothetical protein
MQRAKDCGRRERLVLWWLTYKLPVEREVDDVAMADAAAVARWDVAKIGKRYTRHLLTGCAQGSFGF